jgi:hypothetical protein
VRERAELFAISAPREPRATDQRRLDVTQQESPDNTPTPAEPRPDEQDPEQTPGEIRRPDPLEQPDPNREPIRVPEVDDPEAD